MDALRGFLFSSGLSYAGTTASLALSVAFYGLSLRMGKDAFGALNAVTALMFLLYAGRTAAGSYVVIHTAGNGQLLMPVARRSMQLALLLSVGIAGLFFVSAPSLQRFLHLSTPAPFILIALATLPSIVAGIVDGILNVQRRFGALALSGAIGPLTHVLLALILFEDGYQDTDVGWILFGGQLGSCLNVFLVDRSFLDDGPAGSRRDTALRDVITLFCASLLFGASQRMDILWARHTLPVDAAGSYAIAATVALVLFLVSSGLGRIGSVSLRTGGRRVLGLSYLLIGGTSLLLGGAFVLAGESMLSTIVRTPIEIEWNVLIPLFVAVTCYAVIFFDYTCLNVLTKGVHVGIGVALVAIQGVALSAFGTSGPSIALTQCAVMGSLMIVHTANLSRALKRRPMELQPHPAESHLQPIG